jgi:hypothetical protein
MILIHILILILILIHHPLTTIHYPPSIPGAVYHSETDNKSTFFRTITTIESGFCNTVKPV